MRLTAPVNQELSRHAFVDFADLSGFTSTLRTAKFPAH